MNRLAGTEKPRSWKATNDTTNPLGARHGLVTGDLPLNGGSEWRKLPRLDKTEELLAGNVGARPVRHRDDGILGGLEVQERWHCGCGINRRVEGNRERKKMMGRQSPEPAPDARF
jgi:hypothetical protein